MDSEVPDPEVPERVRADEPPQLRVIEAISSIEKAGGFVELMARETEGIGERPGLRSKYTPSVAPVLGSYRAIRTR